jgi:hypothetical protein
MVKFSDNERRILSYLSIGSKFVFDSVEYTVLNSGKPTCSAGEPKTDIYVLALSQHESIKEFKITFKMSNADFLENKILAERAEQIFGEDWQTIITESTMQLLTEFNSKPQIYIKKFGRTKAGSFTLGWRFEIVNKVSGKLSGSLVLSRDQLIDVYAGTKLCAEKRNAIVCEQTIIESGIANFILIDERVNDAQSVIDNLIPIGEYVDQFPNIYFACKALNYRLMENKWEGNRSLSVFIDWSIKDGKLSSDIVFDNPLVVKGHEVANKLLCHLGELNINTLSDITTQVIDEEIKLYI